MPSITFWNRLEPGQERATSQKHSPPGFAIPPGCSPASGSSASSPAKTLLTGYIKVAGTTSKVCGWGTTGALSNVDADNPPPLESVALREPFSENDLPTQVELGQWFERLLGGQGAEAAKDAFLAQYPITAPAQPDDARAARLRALWQGRAIDGLACTGQSRHPAHCHRAYLQSSRARPGCVGRLR